MQSTKYGDQIGEVCFLSLSLSFNENVNSNRADNKTSRWLAAADADAVLNWSQTGQTRFSVPGQPQKLGKLNSGFLPLYTTAAKRICKSLNRTQREREWIAVNWKLSESVVADQLFCLLPPQNHCLPIQWSKFSSFHRSVQSGYKLMNSFQLAHWTTKR